MARSGRRQADLPPRSRVRGRACRRLASCGGSPKRAPAAGARAALTIHACALPAVAILHGRTPTVSMARVFLPVLGPAPCPRAPIAKGNRILGARPWVLPPAPCHD